jgi:hypothetical protein
VVRTPALIDGGKFGKLLQPVPRDAQQEIFERQHPMPPDRFAAKALRAVAQNQAIIVIPSWWRLIWWLYRLSPALGFRLGAWGRRKYLETAKRAAERLPPNQPQPTGTSGSVAGAGGPSGAAPAAER